MERRSDEQKKTAEEMDVLRKKRHEVEAQLDALTQQREQSSEELEKLAAHRAGLEGQLVEARAGVTVADTRLKELEGDKKKLEGDLVSTRQERDEVKRSLEELQSVKGALEGRGQELEDRLKATEVELEQLARTKSELEKEVTQSHREVAKLRADLELAREEREAEREKLVRRQAAEDKWADELHRLREEKKALNEHIAGLAGDRKSEELISQMKAEREHLIHSLASQKKERLQVEDAAGVLRRELHGLRRELVEAEERAESLSGMAEMLISTEERLARTQADLTRTLEEKNGLEKQVGELATARAMVGETRRTPADKSSGMSAVEESREGRSFAGEEARCASLPEEAKTGEGEGPETGSGATPGDQQEGTTLDPRLGPIYSAPPPESDDLTELKGLGGAILARLNEAGIYTFWQIARWKGPQVKAISEDLSLRDRVKRYEWQKQAAALHEAKYGKTLRD